MLGMTQTKGHTGGYKVLGLILGLAVAFFAVGVTAASAQGGASAVAVETGADGRYIVVFNDNVADPRGLSVALGRQHGFTVRSAYSVALKGFAATLPGAAVNALANDPRVAFVEADRLMHISAQTVPTGVRRIGGLDNANLTIDGFDNDRIDVDVAVIDTGVFAHDDLVVAGRVDCTGGPRNTNCKNGGDDGHGHGTHVAGTIAALDNGIGVVGVAPGARIWSVKVLKNNGSGWTSNIVGGIDWVAGHGGIEVINLSLGGGGSDDGDCGNSNNDSMHKAICGAVAAGVVVVVAAGNDSGDASSHVPASYDEVITVSALADFDGEPGGNGAPTCRTDEDDTLANFSNYGADVDVIAPGVCTFSTWNDGGYNTISGTSMAAPHVAGAAALLAASGIAPAAIRAAIVDNGNLDWDNSDDGDSVKERLLDVSDATVFAPGTEAGSGDGGPVNAAPTASIISPAEGATYASGATVDFTGAASDDEDGDLTASLSWSSSIDGPLGSGASPSAALGDGVHTITATVTDQAGASSSDTIGITVGNPPLTATFVNIVDIAHIVTGKGKKKLSIKVGLTDDLGGAVAGATVSIRSALVGTSRVWAGSGTTGSNGSVTFKLTNAPAGSGECYDTTITAIASDLDDSIAPVVASPWCSQ